MGSQGQAGEEEPGEVQCDGMKPRKDLTSGGLLLAIQPIQEEDNEEHGLESVSSKDNSMHSKQLQAVDMDLKKENREREMAEEEEDKERDSEEGDLEAKKKANQLKDDIALVIAIILILILTAAIVFGKIYLFSPDIDANVSTFRPLEQSKNSAMKYSGPGFLPCNGLQPCQLDHFPPERNGLRLEGAEAEWNG